MENGLYIIDIGSAKVCRNGNNVQNILTERPTQYIYLHT